MPLDVPPTRTDTRELIVDAATVLLAEGGRAAVSTRAVCAAASVQAPTMYRIFGDKQGLLDAVAARCFATHLQAHAAAPATADPVADLERGWDVHVGFGLANPYLYSLVYGEPRPGPPPPGARDAERHLAALVHRVAVAGRLAVDERRAVQLLTAAGTGTTLTLIATPGARRSGPGLSHLAREAVMAAITGRAPVGTSGPVSAAVALRAVLDRTTGLTDGERMLLAELLDRIARPGG